MSADCSATCALYILKVMMKTLLAENRFGGIFEGNTLIQKYPH